MKIDRIIGKLMGGDSIVEERSAIESWKREAEENMRALEDIHKIAKLSDGLKGYHDYNADSAWDRFADSIGDAPSDSSIVQSSDSSASLEGAKIFGINRWLKVAAAVIVLIGSVFSFNNYGSGNVEEFQMAEYQSTDNLEVIDLVDGSTVQLDNTAKLRTTSLRSVSLKGRGYFVVDSDMSNPFSVNIPIGKVIVTGTKFMVSATDVTTDIFLEEGKVTFVLNDQEYILNPGDLLRVSKGFVEIIKLNDANYMSWIDDKLIFNDNTLQEVVESLSRHFGKIVELENISVFKNCNVKSIFENYELEQILNELNTTHGLEYEMRGDKYVVTDSSC